MKWLGALVMLGVFAGDTASAQVACTRHIYNYSNCTWYFVQRPGPFAGAIAYTGVSGCRRRPAFNSCAGQACAVGPGCVFEIKYYAPAGLFNRVIEIYDDRRNGQAWQISNSGFGSCPHIVHHGNTGGVSMNEPASGDFAIGQCRW